MKGIIPKTMPRLGSIEDTIKNKIPMNKPSTILLLKLDDLCLPKIKGIAKNNIITVDNGLNIFSQNIFF